MKTEQRYEIIDNLKGISKLQDNSIDLTVTSPPYDALRTYNGYSFDFEKLAHGLYRVTKDGGVVVWIVGDQTIDGSETLTSFKQALFFKEIGFKVHDTMIYAKNPRFPDANRYQNCFEYMFVFSKGIPKTVHLIQDKLNRKRGISGIGSTDRNIDGTLRQSWLAKTKGVIKTFGVRHNIFFYSTGRNSSSKDDYVFEHPAIFPEQLAKDHILSWSNEGDTILDPFLGSGTTLKMCMETNRNGIGFEINEGYENIIRKRLKLDIAKLDAFDD